MRIFSVFIFIFSSFTALAEDSINFSSFGTLGLTLSDSENYGYRPDIGSDRGVFKNDIDFLSRSLIGLQLDSTLSHNFDVVTQVVIKDVPRSSFDNYLSLAFLRYSPSPKWRFRVGRTAPDLFLITEFRNINFAYNWAAVPTEVYGVIPYRHIDGLDIDYSTKLLKGMLSTKVFTGRSFASIPTEISIEKIKIKNIIGFFTKFEKNDWVLQARHSSVITENEGDANKLLISSIKKIPNFIWPNASNFSETLKLKGAKFKFSSLGFQTYINQWLLSSEVSRVNSNTSMVPKITSGYGSLAYQKNEHTFFGLLGFVKADNYTFSDQNINKNNAPELVSSIEKLGNFYAFNQESFSVGWRWDISSFISSTVQLSSTEVDNSGGSLWIKKTNSKSSERINTLFINLSWAL